MNQENEFIKKRLETGPRVDFQLHILDKMLIDILGEDEFEKIDSEKKHDTLNELMDNSEYGYNFGQKIAQIIDNEKNISIRSSIEKDYKEGEHYKYIENQYREALKSELMQGLYDDALQVLKKSLLVHQ